MESCCICKKKKVVYNLFCLPRELCEVWQVALSDVTQASAGSKIPSLKCWESGVAERENKKWVCQTSVASDRTLWALATLLLMHVSENVSVCVDNVCNKNKLLQWLLYIYLMALIAMHLNALARDITGFCRIVYRRQSCLQVNSSNHKTIYHNCCVSAPSVCFIVPLHGFSSYSFLQDLFSHSCREMHKTSWSWPFEYFSRCLCDIFSLYVHDAAWVIASYRKKNKKPPPLVVKAPKQPGLGLLLGSHFLSLLSVMCCVNSFVGCEIPRVKSVPMQKWLNDLINKQAKLQSIYECAHELVDRKINANKPVFLSLFCCFLWLS